MLIGLHFSPLEILVMLAAGFGAGVIGSTAGLASLISYPALLALGLPPVVANVTNTVGLIGSSIGSVAGSRIELRGQATDIKRWLGPAASGGAVGAALLLLGPKGAFEHLVPYLVAGASGLLLASPRIRALRAGRTPNAEPPGGPAGDDRASGRRTLLVPIGIFLTCVYGGYFGAAAGVMILALLLAATEKPLPTANAVKNLLLGVANAIAAIGFIIFGDVQWAAVIPMAVGCVAGGSVGPALLRRLPPNPVRIAIALAGFGLAIKLWLN